MEGRNGGQSTRTITKKEKFFSQVGCYFKLGFVEKWARLKGQVPGVTQHICQVYFDIYLFLPFGVHAAKLPDDANNI